METTDVVPALDCATMEQLTDEIGRRTRAHIVTYATETKGEPEASDHRVLYGGGVMAAAGLSRYAKEYFAKVVDEMIVGQMDACRECDCECGREGD